MQNLPLCTRADPQAIQLLYRLDDRIEEFKDDIKAKKIEIQTYDETSSVMTRLEDNEKIPYQIGDVLVKMTQAEIQETLDMEKRNCEIEISEIEEKIDADKVFMFKIKTLLYAKFGYEINLKTKSDSEESREQPILCQYCDKEYLGKRNLMAHIKRMHRIQDEGFEQGNLLRGIDNSSVCGASP